TRENKKDITNLTVKNSELKIQVAKLSRDFEEIKSKEMTTDYSKQLQIFSLTKNEMNLTRDNSFPFSSKKRPVLFIFIIVAGYLIKQYVAEEKRRKAAQKASSVSSDPERGRRSKKIGVDARFFAQVRKLLPICIPGFASKETVLLISLALVLIARTWLDIWFSGFNGHVVKAIVSRDRKTFIALAVVEFGFMMHANKNYSKDIVFYKISNLDNRIQNADQLLTQDIDKFAENLSHLYSDFAKPLVDMVLFAYKLGEA
ncbi:33219_t:CDS:2, partial [Racocetra persica]